MSVADGEGRFLLEKVKNCNATTGRDITSKNGPTIFGEGCLELEVKCVVNGGVLRGDLLNYVLLIRSE